MSSFSRHDLANALRVLAMDAVQAAHSGHPGMPMGMADIAEVLWRDVLRFNPNNPHWVDRDRFILSNGHGAMLQYALLHLTGYDLTIDDIKKFRQYHSKTPGHPEYGETPGIEATTGPLGQGLANGVGMAIAERHLAAQFNRPNHPIVDHYTYLFIGDGCMMEGISHEACSLAGTLGLGKLIVFYDDNGISIDGDVRGWFTDDTPKRFAAYHWHVIPNVDGHDPLAISQAITAARAETNKPSLICCKTQIGFGAPTKAGTAEAHGAPLGDDEIAAARQQLGWNHAPFEIPQEIYQEWNMQTRGAELEANWQQRFDAYRAEYPQLAAEFIRRTQDDLPENWLKQSFELILKTNLENKTMATRKASQHCLNLFGPLLPELIGGSADLTESNCTFWKNSLTLGKENFAGNYINYGVREFAMSAIMNGMALHKGLLPYGGTFLVFADYARNAVRLAALMKQRVIFIYTHDSIGLGEDGPTHQPIEHAAMLRMTPGLRVWRPCDLTETAVAWQQAIDHQGPSCLLLTRQNCPAQKRTVDMIPEIARGGYILWEATGPIMGIIIATGSEVELAIQAAQQLSQQNITVRVVSMPCCEVFKDQDDTYRESVLPSHVQTRLLVEAAAPDYWYQFVGLKGKIIGLDHFGASAPAEKLFAAFNFTVENVKQEMLGLIKKNEVIA